MLATPAEDTSTSRWLVRALKKAAAIGLRTWFPVHTKTVLNRRVPSAFVFPSTQIVA